MKHLVTELNGDSPKKDVQIQTELENGTLTISTPDGKYDCLIAAVEIWEGELRVLVWPDPNNTDSPPITTTIKELT